MKKKNLIISFALNMTLIICMIVAVVFVSNKSQVYGASIDSFYASMDVRGSVSATYNLVDRFSGKLKATNVMTTCHGNEVISFGSSTGTNVGLLNPAERVISLSAENDLVVTYSFTADDTYYAGLSVVDKENTQTNNIAFYYSIDGEEYKEFEMQKAQYLKMEKGTTTAVSIKIHIINTACNANMSGTINWNLTVDSGAYDVQQAKIVEMENLTTNNVVNE